MSIRRNIDLVEAAQRAVPLYHLTDSARLSSIKTRGLDPTHRLAEADNLPTDEDELQRIEQQLEPLMKRWYEIIGSRPANADSAWWDDTEKGGLWYKVIRPLHDRRNELKKRLVQARRQRVLQTRRDNDGFDKEEILYHGTNSEFEKFDRSKGRSAEHLYTSPDLETAEQYGSHVYAIYGRQHPQANLSIEASENPGFYQLCRRLHRRGAFKQNYHLNLQEFIEKITDGTLYEVNGRLQDDVIGWCFSMGFKSVRITDPKPGADGGYSDSVIFDDPDDLQIIEKVE